MIWKPPPPVRVSTSRFRWEVWGTPTRSDQCPGWMWRVNKATGATDIHGWICASPSHEYEYCAPAWAARHLDYLNDVFRRYEVIWFADVEYDPKLLNRLDQRRHANRAESVVIRRHRGRVFNECARFHIYADKELRP